jgi:hypothetical protein
MGLEYCKYCSNGAFLERIYPERNCERPLRIVPEPRLSYMKRWLHYTVEPPIWENPFGIMGSVVSDGAERACGMCYRYSGLATHSAELKGGNAFRVRRFST